LNKNLNNITGSQNSSGHNIFRMQTRGRKKFPRHNHDAQEDSQYEDKSLHISQRNVEAAQKTLQHVLMNL
jgi:hypothetical protein